ncbi:hypothetical protein [Neotabrizicola sp. sgz301269]|uniref:hypothetical protein n=1 Tax=Neotabrizicola sp. sgz301269 TaxID=3276282 RepID=UPI0037707168
MTNSEGVWVERLSRGAAPTEVGSSIRLPALEAVKGVLEGEYQLAVRQVGPPYALTEAVSARLRDLTALGPKLPESTAGGALIEKILRNGVRQDFLEGHNIRWVEGPRRLRWLAENCWVAMEARQSTICSQLRRILEAVQSGCRQFQTSEMPSPNVMKRERLVRMPFDGIAYPTHRLCQLPPDWYEYFLGLEELKELTKGGIATGLAETRILAFEDRPQASVQISPSRNILAHPKDSTWYFLTRDLPPNWFKTRLPKHLAIIEARRWLERAGKEITARGKRMSRADGIAVMTEKFGLSTAAATEAWDGCEHPSRRASGRIPASMVVKLSEIKCID